MSKQRIDTANAPAAIGPYSQAVAAGGFVFLSGQLPVNPADGSVPTTVAEQTKQSLENAAAVLNEAGLSMADVVKTTVFLKDMGTFAEMNEVYATFFPETPPARTTVEAARLPKDVLVEIDAIAVAK